MSYQQEILGGYFLARPAYACDLLKRAWYITVSSTSTRGNVHRVGLHIFTHVPSLYNDGQHADSTIFKHLNVYRFILAVFVSDKWP